jgi:hypothetical protein
VACASLTMASNRHVGEMAMYLIEIFLPLSANDGRPIPSAEFEWALEQMVREWGGVTAFTRTPAQGLSFENGDQRVEDDIIVYEVMVDGVDRFWWQNFKRELEERFQQRVVLIRVTAVDVIQ